MSGVISAAPQDPKEIAKAEFIELPHFTADDAYTLGTSLREKLRKLFPDSPAVVNITLANSNQLLYHACSTNGTQPDNDLWVARKRKTVLRWGKSSYCRLKEMGGDEDKFKAIYQLGDSAGDYTIHGGAVPVRVKGVEGLVAVCTVSGLHEEDDHQIVVEGLGELKKTMTDAAGEY